MYLTDCIGCCDRTQLPLKYETTTADLSLVLPMDTMDMTPHTMKRMGKKVKHMTVIIVPFRGHNASPVDSGVTATDFCKLLRNTGLHDEYSKDNEEDIQNKVIEGEKSITPCKIENENKNDPNDHQNELKIKQENEIQEDELEDYSHD